MTYPARFSLTAPRSHALAEGVRLAFEARGTDLAVVAAQGEGDFRLILRRGAEPPIILRDPVAVLELSEDLHPDQPLHPRDPVRRAEHRQALARLPALARHLDHLIQSTDARDVDLNTHHLRGQIGPLSALLAHRSSAERAFSLLDLAAAPIIWRLDAIDRSFETHLLAGYDHLRDRQDWLSRHAQVSGVLDNQVLADWLQTVFATKGFITQPDATPDWSTALGPSEKPYREENDLPSGPQRTKVHSIGGPARIR